VPAGVLILQKNLLRQRTSCIRKAKLVPYYSDDDETENSIAFLGPEDEIERMWRALEWQEKGMVKVAGLLGE
jgi:hypothetical protein